MSSSSSSSNSNTSSSSSNSNVSAVTAIDQSQDQGRFLFPGISFDGLICKQRVASFTEIQWPWTDNDQWKCTPDKLALAGLTYFGGSTSTNKFNAKCVACLETFENLNGTSDPWKIHSEKNSDCLYIRLGKRESSRDYKVHEIMDLVKYRHVATVAHNYKSMQLELYNNLLMMAQCEKDMKNGNTDPKSE